MSNTIRPWFRRSNIAKDTPQGSTDQVQPRPAGRFPPPPQQRLPPSPPKREVTPPPPPPTSSPWRVVTPNQAAQRSPDPPMRLPTPKDIKETPVSMGEPMRKSPLEVSSPVRKPSQDPSQRYVKSELQSPRAPPKSKASSPKLSPYSLPPSHLGPLPEYDISQEKVVIAEKLSKVHEREEHRHGNSKKTLPLERDDANTRFITMAGENKGATMEIIHSPRNGRPNYPTKTRQSSVLRSSSSDDGERKMMNADGSWSLPMKAFMNSNVQMINNSIVYNSKATHHDPGVHFSHSK